MRGGQLLKQLRPALRQREMNFTPVIITTLPDNQPLRFQPVGEPDRAVVFNLEPFR